jgi:hypothetical protein
MSNEKIQSSYIEMTNVKIQKPITQLFWYLNFGLDLAFGLCHL